MDDIQVAKEIREAIKRGDTKTVVALVGSDKSRQEMMTVFGTWLHVAASFGQLDIVKRLVDLGADINRRAASVAVDHLLKQLRTDTLRSSGICCPVALNWM